MNNALFESAPDFDQPIAVLKHCHNKIRKQLLTLQKLQEHLPQFGANIDATQGASAILRYFNEAAPKHHADEEQDLLPMLRTTAIGDDAQLLNVLLPEIMREHQEMDSLWTALAQQLQLIASGASSALSTPDVTQFVSLYEAHMEKEESHIAPMAKRLFDSAQMLQLGQAMRRRRGIDHTN